MSVGRGHVYDHRNHDFFYTPIIFEVVKCLLVTVKIEEASEQSGRHEKESQRPHFIVDQDIRINVAFHDLTILANSRPELSAHI